MELVKTRLNEGEQITAVRFECVFCSASGVSGSHCAEGEPEVAAEGWPVTALGELCAQRLTGTTGRQLGHFPA